MFNLVEKRRYYFLFSGIITLIGVITLIYSTIETDRPLQLSIDFTGGQLFELQFTEPVEEQELRDTFTAAGFQQLVVQELTPLETELLDETAYPDGSRWSVRTEEVDDVASIDDTLAYIEENLNPLDLEATTTSEVSGAVGDEVTQAAILATLAATAVTLIFMWFAFRRVPHPFRYGACAIAAMIHDILIMLTAMSILGLLFDWQADTLFLTAMLTVVGFSVQDTIVVFDRIRENIPKRRNETYETVVNRSILETIHRSLATQLNAIFVMVAIALFGGETIRQFIIILLVGLTTGTYSSIFIAVPLLVAWQKGEIPFLKPSEEEVSAPAVRASA
ncbi:MAG: protein translocase subunit SecF [Anaerolineae bacterium]|nr:MAG: protein translocase subunit SecF [Anaerolineae bacterium]